jgi:hypothetical protein
VGRCCALALVLAGGCARKAPGPEECYDFTVRWTAAEGRTAPGGRLRISEDEFVRRVNACITTPFDRKLLRCVEQGASPRLCLVAFKDRLARSERE